MGQRAETAADQPRADRPDGEDAQRGKPDRQQLPGELAVDLVQGDPDGRERDDLRVAPGPGRSAPDAARTGTTARMDRPSVPVYSWVNGLPWGAPPRSPMNGSPMRAGSGWE